MPAFKDSFITELWGWASSSFFCCDGRMAPGWGWPKPGEATLSGNQRLAADRKPGEATLAGNQRLAADRNPGETALAGIFSPKEFLSPGILA